MTSYVTVVVTQMLQYLGHRQEEGKQKRTPPPSLCFQFHLIKCLVNIHTPLCYGDADFEGLNSAAEWETSELSGALCCSISNL